MYMAQSNEGTPKVFTLDDSNPPRWNEYYAFAHEFDGYEAYPETLYEVAASVAKNWNENGVLPYDLPMLRASLFRQARGSRFTSGYPAEEDMGYLDALVNQIKQMMCEQSASS
jgi:hypothetical protein